MDDSKQKEMMDLFQKSKELSLKISKSVYATNCNFIPAPLIDDIIEIRWQNNKKRDEKARVLNVEAIPLANYNENDNNIKGYENQDDEKYDNIFDSMHNHNQPISHFKVESVSRD